MLTAATTVQARALLAVLPRPLAFVPTMGALHAGHLALATAAGASCESVAASVFVNPLQFGPGEDLARYPRDYEADLAALQQHGVDLVFAPEAESMYPTGFSTAVDVGPIGHSFEGAIRPTHFAGVATVVAKLLNIMQPDMLFLGQKDAQQTAVLRRLVRDLAIPTQVRVVPTVRDTDGLALSSRNAYLSPDERRAAPSLYAALTALRLLLYQGMEKGEAVAQAATVLSPAATLDYLDVVDADTFEPLEQLRAPAFIIGAARFGRTRLLDNLWITA
ncbi:MAG: pantoate--beta-alanine ligase [Candidatus Eremiobacteraeota bacterium]|nr:pantoate--beta-alanine ligase [Candidatus Eremiobacteraeota bacterium]